MYSLIQRISPSKHRQQQRQQTPAGPTQDDGIGGKVNVPGLPAMVSSARNDNGTSGSPPEHNTWDGYGADNRFHDYAHVAMERENESCSHHTTEELVAHWKEQSKYWRGMAERNQITAAGKSRGIGKNKQSTWMTDPANLSNRRSLLACTKETIWPENKFLHFTGQWTVLNPRSPHPFVSHVMKHVRVPPASQGFESDYYKDFVLPAVSAKLSSLRANFVKACGTAFTGKYCMVL